MQKVKLILSLVPIINNPVYPDSHEHLGLCSLTANARNEGIDCSIIDGFFLKLSYEDYFDEILNLIQPNSKYVIGFSIMAEEFLNNTIRTIKLIKEQYPKITIIAGGMYPTWKYQELLAGCPEIDYILRGECDNTLVDFLKKIQLQQFPGQVKGIAYMSNNKLIEGEFPFIPPELTKLPIPARDFATIAVSRHNLLSISTSRGCDFQCSFCGIPGFNGKRRTRTISQVVEEITILKQNYNPKLINIVDPTFISSGKSGMNQFIELGNELLKLNTRIRYSFEIRPEQVDYKALEIWKEVGIELIHIGVESGYSPTLKLFNKKHTPQIIKKAIDTFEALDIYYSLGFIMFHPWSTIEEIKYNIKYSKTTLRKRNIIGLFNTLRMYSGSDLSRKWTGAFSPYPKTDNYFKDPKVKLFFYKLVSREITTDIIKLSNNRDFDKVYELLLEIISEIEEAK
jgi:radical SAM superfamily enzyme YgiQ (UPF0313 family)